MVEHWLCRAGDLRAIENEWNGEQRTLIDVSEIAIGKIAAKRASAHEYRPLASRKRKRFDRSPIRPCETDIGKQNQIAFRQHLRPGRNSVLTRQVQDSCRNAAGRRNPRQLPPTHGGKDIVIFAPGATQQIVHLAKDNGRSAIDRHFHQFACSPESRPLPIGREEGAPGAFRSSQLSDQGLVEPTSIQAWNPVRTPRHKDKARAVGRQNHIGADLRTERSQRLQFHVELDQWGARGRIEAVWHPPTQHERAHNDDGAGANPYGRPCTK